MEVVLDQARRTEVKKSSTFIEVEGQNDVPIKVSLIEDEGYNHCEQIILLEFGGPTRKLVRLLRMRSKAEE